MTYLTPGEPKKRIRLLVAIVVVLAVIFGIRLVDLQIIEADAINAKSFANRAVSRVLPALRGEIIDSQGKVLAKSVYRYDINAAPSKVLPITREVNGQTVTVSVEQLATEIAAIIEMTPQDVMTKITGTGEYSQIKKRVDAEQYRKVRALEIPWLYYDPIPTRIYPNGAVAGNILGFLGTDGNALEGLEMQYDKCLAGVDGKETFEKGEDGIKIPSSVVTTQRAVPGKDIQLTIDSDLQYFAQQALSSQLAYLQADWGSAIVIEAKTGKILVAAEVPTVDPNVPGKSADQNRGSRIFRASFEPGSTLKTVTAATVVDTGAGTPLTRTVAPYSWSIPGVGYTVTDSHAHGYDKLTLTGVLRDSSNTGIMKIGQSVPYTVRYQYLQKFGLGAKTGVGYPGEESGLLNPVDKWDGIKKYVSMFGQGISVTPIQSAFLYQTIANKGVRLQPQLVDGCIDANGNETKNVVKPGVRAISEKTASETASMLEMNVIEGGVGRTGGVPGYRVGGKSGTAQITDPNTGRYGPLHAISFIGMAPIEDPQYVVAVTFFKSRTVSNALGATPVFKKLFQQVLRDRRVPPSTTKPTMIATTW
ncbi:penicillin-binding protein 2 [Rhodoluna sp.]|uniref:peptidoglycan D,D-transpeptidase FtsI family protein n=1 Tax=Rhodoluna sp. TaxID=1969481 RepID=UPI0025DD5D5B|nr:penicillin-binding protein 2 [Rhodoluna sp.]